ncbi:uncharacterized protein LOC115757568 [Rhodamnia argentea]|uniref:Uncharacterized protein LOC115757568 n=1 Tax=Rhodamnia argentea TaxID=178133 RepID=A0A8B8R2V0_9MYRT|nr:uncharacterized protein LOC115757568 [Rhodamnia argentea]
MLHSIPANESVISGWFRRSNGQISPLLLQPFRTKFQTRFPITCSFTSSGWSSRGGFKRHVVVQGAHPESDQEAEDQEEFRVMAAVRSEYNDIVIVDTARSRFLLLDSTHNVHSTVNKGEDKWTGSYWDEFASLPAIVPEGSPIAIFGLGGGTAAHLMLQLWPWLRIEGWEIDKVLIDKAREYMGLSELEKPNGAGGMLSVHVGDVLSPRAKVDGGYYAGIAVDLFAGGRVLPQLQEVETWLELKERLMPSGRIMVNCGGIDDVNPTGITREWERNSTIRAMSSAFPGELSWRRMAQAEGENYLALTGLLPDLDLWSARVPGRLSNNVREWRPCI